MAGVLVVFAIALTISPLYHPVPWSDSGTFLYVGQQILDGKMPYKDVWDHKPPAIYYINALGLLIGGGSPWGAWILELLALLSAATLGFLAIKRAFGAVPALFGSASWLLALPYLIRGGGLLEEYALSLQFGSLYLFQKADEGSNYGWKYVLIGALTGVCFLLKQNFVAIGLSIGFVAILTRAMNRDWRGLLGRLAALGLGTGAPLLLVGVYFLAQGVLDDLWNQAFVFNFELQRAANTRGLTPFLKPLFIGLQTLSFSGLSIVALAGWLLGVIYLRSNKCRGNEPLLVASLVGLPLSLLFLLATTTGRTPVYYFIVWLPPFAVFSAFFAYILVPEQQRDSLIITKSGNSPPAIVLVFVLVAAMAALPGFRLLSDLRYVGELGGTRGGTRDVVRYIMETTDPNDAVLMWGSGAYINFPAHRRSITKYVVQVPIYMHPNTEDLEQFLQKLQAEKPVIIIDTSPTNLSVPSIDPDRRKMWMQAARLDTLAPGLDKILAYISSNYILVDTVGPDHWSVYRYAENP